MAPDVEVVVDGDVLRTQGDQVAGVATVELAHEVALR